MRLLLRLPALHYRPLVRSLCAGPFTDSVIVADARAGCVRLVSFRASPQVPPSSDIYRFTPKSSASSWFSFGFGSDPRNSDARLISGALFVNELDRLLVLETQPASRRSWLRMLVTRLQPPMPSSSTCFELQVECALLSNPRAIALTALKSEWQRSPAEVGALCAVEGVPALYAFQLWPSSAAAVGFLPLPGAPSPPSAFSVVPDSDRPLVAALFANSRSVRLYRLVSSATQRHFVFEALAAAETTVPFACDLFCCTSSAGGPELLVSEWDPMARANAIRRWHILEDRAVAANGQEGGQKVRLEADLQPLQVDQCGRMLHLWCALGPRRFAATHWQTGDLLLFDYCEK